MTTILLIETATAACSVGIARNGKLLAMRETLDQRSHAEFITVFIDELMQETGLTYDELDAVALSKGPGSYTGLRIGVSTAKGICYAMDKPLIAIETLYAMAAGVHRNFQHELDENDLLCPMIDARRMEVYTAVFDAQMQVVLPTEALVIDDKSFEDLLEKQRMVFFGDGSEKCREALAANRNALFLADVNPSVSFMVEAAFDAYARESFEDAAYFEPFYLKDFVAGIPHVKGLH
ncbi:MAG: tRNA (adenosine(37)-N6)-threonylcarbamoyltransferase complex dimerization subunit type 1 TsaB [Bacteroidetes bacterium]|nr:tRNA (adenosine(37)-N6)-threonylcarbamoyltransferase complex dimerization subunit type 1 TsaB [Bacteroidota bacterium]